MRSLLLLLCASALTGLTFGQGANGTITGTVTDPSGAIIPEARVDVRNTGTGTLATATSTATGNYTIPQLPVGTYDMSVVVTGFKAYNRQGLELAATQIMRIDIPLQVGSNAESVTITADASLLKTESGALAQNVTVSQMNNLPILQLGGAGSANGAGFRDPFGLAQMMPGTNYSANGTMVVNGTPNGFMQQRVDGQISGNLGSLKAFTNQTQPSVDAIQEVAVQASNYSAEFGAVGGGIFNATMKSGTNQFHGSAYDYSTNDAINSHQPYTGLRTAQHRYDFGATFGGPVRIPKVYNGTNKTFFFFSIEQFREKLLVTSTSATVPIQAYRDGNFQPFIIASGSGGAGLPIQTSKGVNYVDPLGFSPLAGTIFNPTTEQTVVCNKSATPSSSCTNGQSYQVRTAFPSNLIPATSFDPVSLNVLKLVPLPIGPNAAAGQYGSNFQVPWVSTRYSPLPSIKLDQTMGAKGRLSGYWQSTGTQSQYSTPNGNAEGLPQPLTQARGSFTSSKTIRANYDYTLTSSTLIHLGAGWNSNNFNDHAPDTNYNALTALGLRGATLNRTFPQIQVGATATATGGMSNFGPGAQSQSFERRPSGTVNVTSVKGNHTLKLGAEYRLEKYPTATYTNTSGTYGFGSATIPNSTIQTALQGVTTTQGGQGGFNFASFMLGDLASASLSQVTAASISKSQWGLFVQDSWKVTRKLSLDLGLRWDYGTYAREQYGRYSNFDFATANPAAGGHNGAQIFEANCNCNFASNYPYAIGPRFGFAYQLDSKTVIRGGFGVVYTATNTASGSATNTASAGTPAFGQAVGKFKDGMPASVQPQWPVFSPSVGQAIGTVVAAPTYLDPNVGRPAKQYQWSVGLQRELNRNLVVEASYVANRGVWWPAGALAPINVLSQADLARYGFTNLTSGTESGLLTATIANLTAAQKSTLQARGIVLPYSNFPTSQTVRQSLLPFPQYTGTLAPSGAPLGKTWYDSLQVNITQRFSHGLSLNANYTLAKNLDLMSADDTFNRDSGKDYSVNDVPHQFRMTAEYQIPILSKSRIMGLSNRGVSAVLSNWGIGWFVQYQSAPVLARPASVGTFPINNFLGRGPGSATLKTDANGNYMNPWSVDWTDYSGTHHTDPIDINCHCFDPTKTVVLNPAAWQNIPDGQFTSSSSSLRFYRGIRTPQENLNISRNFRFGEKAVLHIRAEFQNVTNRTRLQTNTSAPSNLITTSGFAASPMTFPTGSNQGLYSGGFGTIVPTGGTPGARTGTLIGRITF